jgi:hypothetical protein
MYCHEGVEGMLPWLFKKHVLKWYLCHCKLDSIIEPKNTGAGGPFQETPPR